MPVASYSRLILTRDRGNPVIFSLGLGPERSALRELVERHGGLLEDPRHKDESGFRISLADPAQKLHDASKDLFRLDYVRDCVQKGQLIPNLRDYRLGEKSVYLDYDPFKVLKGELTWAQLERSKENLDDGMYRYMYGFTFQTSIYMYVLLSSVCSDSDDDGVDGSSRYPMASRPPQSRNPYTQREKEQILCYIVKKRAYNLLKGNEFWIRAAARLNLGRTWQSLKEHFRKQIYPALGSLGGVSKRHQTKIKLGYDGDLVESSFEEEEEESAPAEGPDSRMGTPSVTSTPLVAPASKNASKSPNSLYYDTADENGQAVPEESGRTPPNKKKKTKKLFSQNPTENLVFEPTDEEILVDHR